MVIRKLIKTNKEGVVALSKHTERTKNIARIMTKVRAESEEGRLKKFSKETQIVKITRPAYSKYENRAFGYLKKRMKEMGLNVRIDAYGNLFGRLEGKNPNAKVIMIGSHIDSVTKGGAFDGVLGVAMSIEAVRGIKPYELEHPIEVVVWRGEESARFGKAYLGSSAALGKLTEQDLQRTDSSGITLKQALENSGFKEYKIGEKTIDPSKILVYIEPHVEQGKILAGEKDKRIGIVKRIAGPERYELTFKSEPAHSGATPMEKKYRSDALLAASETAIKTEKIAKRSNILTKILGDRLSRFLGLGKTVGTMTEIKTENANINTIPGTVKAKIDIRSTSDKQKERVANKILQSARYAANKRNVGLEIKELSKSGAVALDSNFTRLLEETAKENSIRYKIMDSGAGHDASSLQSLGIPSVMLFLPSEQGYAHNPKELTKIRDIEKSTELLEKFLRRIGRG